ncbi:hypothetical protein ASPTUDRAFT_127063 [Aspergillus tubingensis CBS 134.48]|uniref:Uncharacterized protein n=1 Tax=Aspergillus tubingensis (strain CBS 134.48) TaxID=767770 RepID=A0A1L9MX78_ASPTC|nr:hypothetical protein ASPTUDRAFT_127063 [Aspergillus tubingensis CBS 134.48]
MNNGCPSGRMASIQGTRLTIIGKASDLSATFRIYPKFSDKKPPSYDLSKADAQVDPRSANIQCGQKFMAQYLDPAVGIRVYSTVGTMWAASSQIMGSRVFWPGFPGVACSQPLYRTCLCHDTANFMPNATNVRIISATLVSKILVASAPSDITRAEGPRRSLSSKPRYLS